MILFTKITYLKSIGMSIYMIHFRTKHQVFPSIIAAEEIYESDSDSEVDTKKKRFRKEKIGFRDRKVKSN